MTEMPTTGPIPGPHTDAEFAAHARAGLAGGVCLVCDDRAGFQATDYHGQGRCRCGATYQTRGSHLTDEWLAARGLAAADVARVYCDCYEWVPLLRAYWRETGCRAPLGTYLGPRPDPPEDRTRFYAWVAQNEARLRPAWGEFFAWDRLLETYSAGFVGAGI